MKKLRNIAKKYTKHGLGGLQNKTSSQGNKKCCNIMCNQRKKHKVRSIRDI